MKRDTHSRRRSLVVSCLPFSVHATIRQIYYPLDAVVLLDLSLVLLLHY
jgi:hypothetical protein